MLHRLGFDSAGPPLEDAITAYDSGRWAAAAALLEPLAAAGRPEALWRLGELYRRGRGVRKDEERGLALTRLAAERGNADALYRLGLDYLAGTIVPTDAAEAARWFRQAARCGHGEAQVTLARLYAEGRGVDRDRVEAYVRYTRAMPLLIPGRRVVVETERSRLADSMSTDRIAEAQLRLTRES